MAKKKKSSVKKSGSKAKNFEWWRAICKDCNWKAYVCYPSLVQAKAFGKEKHGNYFKHILVVEGVEGPKVEGPNLSSKKIKPRKNPLEIDLTKYKARLKKMSVTQVRNLDPLLEKIANYLYDTYEHFNSDFHIYIKSLNKTESKKMLSVIKALDKQVSPFLKIVSDIEYDSNEMDKLLHVLDHIDENINETIFTLKEK